LNFGGERGKKSDDQGEPAEPDLRSLVEGKGGKGSARKKNAPIAGVMPEEEKQLRQRENERKAMMLITEKNQHLDRAGDSPKMGKGKGVAASERRREKKGGLLESPGL